MASPKGTITEVSKGMSHLTCESQKRRVCMEYKHILIFFYLMCQKHKSLIEVITYHFILNNTKSIKKYFSSSEVQFQYQNNMSDINSKATVDWRLLVCFAVTQTQNNCTKTVLIKILPGLLPQAFC